MRSYGGLPNNVLDLEILTCDDNYVRVKDMINDEIVEPIVNATFMLEVDSKGELNHLTSLVVWTDKNVYTLKYSSFGRFFIKERYL